MEAICIADFEARAKEQKKNIDQVKFYEFYGVWFAGKLKQIVAEHFKADLRGRMHVFISPDQFEKDKPVINDGIHEISVYGHHCYLYKWMAQGYHRGLVVLADDDQANAMANVYYETKTWSWRLNDIDKAKLPGGITL